MHYDRAREGKPKALMTSEEIEILGRCWQGAAHHHKKIDVATGEVYLPCTNCRMNHDNPLGLTAKQIDLMVSKLVDTARRPRLKKPPAPQKGTQQQWQIDKQKAWEQWKQVPGPGGVDTAETKKKKREHKCSNCKDPSHSHQQCDPETYPNIHDFCWKCNTHGHNAKGCRGQPTQEEWEAAADKECIKAVAKGQPWHDKYRKPLTGGTKRPDPNATGRNADGGKVWVNWTKTELDKRKETKDKESAIRAPILAEIKKRYPLLKADPP